MKVIAIGNAFDGITLIGPFPNAEEATSFGEDYYDDTEWHVIDVMSLNDAEAERCSIPNQGGCSWQ